MKIITIIIIIITNMCIKIAKIYMFIELFSFISIFSYFIYILKYLYLPCYFLKTTLFLFQCKFLFCWFFMYSIFCMSVYFNSTTVNPHITKNIIYSYKRSSNFASNNVADFLIHALIETYYKIPSPSK